MHYCQGEGAAVLRAWARAARRGAIVRALCRSRALVRIRALRLRAWRLWRGRVALKARRLHLVAAHALRWAWSTASSVLRAWRAITQRAAARRLRAQFIRERGARRFTSRALHAWATVVAVVRRAVQCSSRGFARRLCAALRAWRDAARAAVIASHDSRRVITLAAQLAARGLRTKAGRLLQSWHRVAYIRRAATTMAHLRLVIFCRGALLAWRFAAARHAAAERLRCRVAETSARAMLRSWRQYSEVRDGFVLGGLIWPNIPADLTPVGMLGTSTFVVF